MVETFEKKNRVNGRHFREKKTDSMVHILVKKKIDLMVDVKKQTNLIVAFFEKKTDLMVNFSAQKKTDLMVLKKVKQKLT